MWVHEHAVFSMGTLQTFDEGELLVSFKAAVSWDMCRIPRAQRKLIPPKP
jgi:hypothetical protein